VPKQLTEKAAAVKGTMCPVAVKQAMPAFSADDFVVFAVFANRDRLDQPVVGDALRQLFECVVVERFAGVVVVRLDLLHRDCGRFCFEVAVDRCHNFEFYLVMFFS
jgi:hypothetical protein